MEIAKSMSGQLGAKLTVDSKLLSKVLHANLSASLVPRTALHFSLLLYVLRNKVLRAGGTCSAPINRKKCFPNWGAYELNINKHYLLYNGLNRFIYDTR